jgi:hypothetical protein
MQKEPCITRVAVLFSALNSYGMRSIRMECYKASTLQDDRYRLVTSPVPSALSHRHSANSVVVMSPSQTGIVVDISKNYGCFFLGTLLAMGLWGIHCIQTSVL